MPDLILMPKSRPLMSHVHHQDTTGFHVNCMSPQMPAMTHEQLDFTSDFGEIVGLWGDQIYGMTQHTPRYSFWSLDELRVWVRDHAASDVYLTMHAGMGPGIHLCSTDQPTIEKLRHRFFERKSHLVQVRMDSLMTNEVGQWITENCAGKTETILGSISSGGRENQYMFRDDSDATLFTVRWKGHGAVEIIS
jgi:hypothetical protein